MWAKPTLFVYFSLFTQSYDKYSKNDYNWKNQKKVLLGIRTQGG